MEKHVESPQPEYDVELRGLCARCGSPHYLLVDEETNEFICAPCFRALRRPAPQPLEFQNEAEDLDFYL